MRDWEFRYYLTEPDMDFSVAFIETEIISAENKIIAEEKLLDILREKHINVARIRIESIEPIPEVEIEELPFEDDETEESFTSFEFEEK